MRPHARVTHRVTQKVCVSRDTHPELAIHTRVDVCIATAVRYTRVCPALRAFGDAAREAVTPRPSTAALGAGRRAPAPSAASRRFEAPRRARTRGHPHHSSRTRCTSNALHPASMASRQRLELLPRSWVRDAREDGFQELSSAGGQARRWRWGFAAASCSRLEPMEAPVWVRTRI